MNRRTFSKMLALAAACPMPSFAKANKSPIKLPVRDFSHRTCCLKSSAGPGMIEPFVLMRYNTVEHSGSQVRHYTAVWLEMFPSERSASEERLLVESAIMGKPNQNQTLADWQRLESFPIGNGLIAHKAGMVGIRTLLGYGEGVFGKPCDGGEVFLVRVRTPIVPGREWLGVWSDSLCAAKKFLKSFDSKHPILTDAAT